LPERQRNQERIMSRMAIALLGLALFGTSACANLMNSGSNETPEGRSTTSGGSALGTPGSNGPATGAPRTVNGGGSGGGNAGSTTSPGDLMRQGSIPGEDKLD
jgi:hypothetical protein